MPETPLTTAPPPPTTRATPDAAGSGSTVDPPALTARTPLPARRPGRIPVALVLLVITAQIVNGLVTNPFFQWDRFAHWFLQPTVLDGLLITLQVTAYSAVFGLLGGIALALARLSGNPVARGLSWVYTWLFRSVPLIVVLLFLYNFSALYPTIGVGIPFGPVFFSVDESKIATDMVVAVVGLSLCEAAYAAEVVRAGILAVDQGQHEAAAALGLPRRRQFTHVIFPQALRAIVPSYVNQLIGLLKASSLVFYVSLLDLFGVVQSMGATNPGDVVPLLLVATTWYVILTSAVSVVQYHVERRAARGALRTLPPTPLQRARAALRELGERRALPPTAETDRRR
ncbi:amino acid ABC transporter permease [Streptomyces sp. BI20]|uniref:amino acid ABC transporter permease n=1 Tax=Streptomyces sp. BI20 TaxID=3403460 RepID=UPI003C778A7B